MSLLRIVYTAPTSTDLGQQVATIPPGSTAPVLEVACHTVLTIDHPPGQRLRLLSPALPVEDSEYKLAVQLPATEQQLDLTTVNDASQQTVKIKLVLKKRSNKPDPPRSAAFRR